MSDERTNNSSGDNAGTGADTGADAGAINRSGSETGGNPGSSELDRREAVQPTGEQQPAQPGDVSKPDSNGSGDSNALGAARGNRGRGRARGSGGSDTRRAGADAGARATGRGRETERKQERISEASTGLEDEPAPRKQSAADFFKNTLGISGDDKKTKLRAVSTKEFCKKFFGTLAIPFGEIWRLEEEEATDLAGAIDDVIKSSAGVKNHPLFLALKTAFPYLNLAMVAGLIIYPRAMLTKMEMAQRVQEQRESQRQSSSDAGANNIPPAQRGFEKLRHSGRRYPQPVADGEGPIN